MKRWILIVVMTIVSNIALAIGTTDSLNLRLSRIGTSVQTLQRENDVLKSQATTLSVTISTQSKEIDSLKSVLAETNNRVDALLDSLNKNISSTREQIQIKSDSLSQTIAKQSQTGLWIFIVIAIILAVIAFVFGKLIAKRGNEVALLSAKADKLNEQIVNRLSSEMSEQKLITTLADRITFMEMTLYKMDSSVRGHKQLSKSIKQMKDNLLANGYELVDMLGKDYHEGMKVTANFVEDENLPEGKQIITGITKPQINYRGKMIQSAQITVNQNL